MLNSKQRAQENNLSEVHYNFSQQCLTALIDVYSRYILGWALSNTMEASFCLEALNQALEQGQSEIINSDQGRQFTGNGWISA
ncbi:integrase catalytic domain-containing protein [Piscirickettsia salmonis]|uniref:DDE-type integrase/transposase/recombinase n=1 Tax=Piscirickettsia salmonis TaxID=1238 RepID=UPI0009BCD9CA